MFHVKGPKGEKGAATRGGAVVVADSNGLPTGFIEGPPGPPGVPGVPGKKVSILLKKLVSATSYCLVHYYNEIIDYCINYHDSYAQWNRRRELEYCCCRTIFLE